MNHPWAHAAVFYHLYPLGCLGAPAQNDFTAPPSSRLAELHAWLPYLEELGINALYLGPVFESSTHGYDTADFETVDRRLGDNAALTAFIAACHARGIRVVLDAVFHHVGRDFWAFKEVQTHGEASAYRDWFHLDFSSRSPHGDPFFYEGWQGHSELVKLNTDHPAVREHLFGAVQGWFEGFGVDGLRLDAADDLDRGFQRDLARFCRALRPDCWLLGEVIHGDYTRWAGPEMLDATTNYALYKGLYSSHNDRNYFEVAHTLQQQFGDGGRYRDLPLYSFADNHDVARVAGVLVNSAHLYPLYTLLLCAPGVPSLYYGSEWGVPGQKIPGSDAPLRPALSPDGLRDAGAHPDLYGVIKKLVQLRRSQPALQRGDYEERFVAHEQLVFSRQSPEETLLVAVNASSTPTTLTLPDLESGTWADLLNPDERFAASAGRLELPLSPTWGRILQLQP